MNFTPGEKISCGDAGDCRVDEQENADGEGKHGNRSGEKSGSGGHFFHWGIVLRSDFRCNGESSCEAHCSDEKENEPNDGKYESGT